MVKTCYHTHCTYCDGSGTPEEMIQAALEKDFRALGFSSHAPVPYPNKFALKEERLEDYCREIQGLKEKYKESIEIYLGLEIDYYPGLSGASSEKWNGLGLDFRIGSVHDYYDAGTKKFLAVDGPLNEMEFLFEEIYKGDGLALTANFYRLVSRMLKEHQFDFLGHFDLIKKRNKGGRFFDEKSPEYKSQALTCLDDVAASGVIMELNTGGLSRKAIDEVYPASWILNEARKRDIPIMINADAHQAAHLDACYERAEQEAKDAGYTEHWELLGGEWQAVKF